MFSSAARSLAVVLVASSCAACAVSSGADDASPPEPTNEVASAMSTPAAPSAQAEDGPAVTPEGLLTNMAESLLDDLLGHALDGLFPSDSIDYDRLARDYAKAANQAAVDQTVWTEQDIIKGKMDTLHDIEDRYQHSAQTRQDALDAYASIDSQWEDINAAVETMMDPKVSPTDLGAWVAGAQIKLSMIGELVALDPDRADGNRGLLVDTAKTYFTHLSQTKTNILQTAMTNRLAQISPCEYWNFGGANFQYVFSDNGVKHRAGGDDLGVCNAARNAYVGTAQTAFLAQETGDLKWMDDTLKAWGGIIAIENRGIVNVTSATFGASCGAAKDNALMLTSLACDTQRDCSYAISTANLGDPAVSCAKDFQVTYTCSGNPAPRTVTIPGEANGQTVQLACL